jgi:hypothetical protein
MNQTKPRKTYIYTYKVTASPIGDGPEFSFLFESCVSNPIEAIQVFREKLAADGRERKHGPFDFKAVRLRRRRDSRK